MKMNLFFKMKKGTSIYKMSIKTIQTGSKRVFMGSKVYNAVHIEKEFMCSTSHFGGQVYI